MYTSQKSKIILTSLLISTLLILLTFFLVGEISVVINVGILSIFILITPIFLYEYRHFLWIKAVEKEFPNFIRDVAGLKKSGMTLAEAIRNTTQNDYGKLTKEVKTLSNKLSWGVPFNRAMDIFKKRFLDSKIIKEAISIIQEANDTGGDVSAILFSLSRDMRTILDAEDERKSIVRQHVMMMYGIFFLFVGISVAIMFVMIPMMESGTEGNIPSGAGLVFSFHNPCTQTYIVFPCMYFDTLSDAFGVGKDIARYYFPLFFSVLIIQAIFMGLIAGQIQENSVSAGIKHSLIMLAFTFLVFTFLIRSKILPV